MPRSGCERHRGALYDISCFPVRRSGVPVSRSAHPAGPRHADLVSLDRLGLRPPSDLNHLSVKVWPATTARRSEQLAVGGVSASELAEQFGTPLFVYDEQDVRDRASQWARAFSDGEVYYASKAFLSIALARWLLEEGLGLDVSTGGELTLALAAGADPARIVFHGNNKSEAELAQAVSAGVRTVVVDSFTEIDRLTRIAAAAGVRQRVLVRVTVGVEAHTHEFVATAHEDQKFGFSLATGAAFQAAQQVLKSDSLFLGGLHSHIGSQIFDTAGFEVAAQRMVGLLARIRAENHVELDELDLGGGLGVAYVNSDTPEPVEQIAVRLHAIVAEQCAAHGLRRPRISVEPGRAIVGPTALTLYRVGTVKDVDLGSGESRKYVSVDGGMSDNIRTALYDAEYTCALASRCSTAEPVLSRVVGRHCESGDIVVRDTYLPADIGPGDLLAVATTGAYCRSMASNYNYVGRPAVVGVRDGGCTLLLRRESELDLLRLDPLWTSDE